MSFDKMVRAKIVACAFNLRVDFGQSVSKILTSAVALIFNL